MTDIFQGGETEQPEVDLKFEDLVGEGKKYRDNDAAARALREKDAFIEQLKREAAEARAEVQKRIKEEEFLTRMEELSRGRQPDPQEPPAREGVVNTPALTVEDIDRRFAEMEAAKRKQANMDAVVSKLQSALGDGYKSHIQKQAQAMGVTTQYLTDVAQNSPEAFFRMIGLTQPTAQRPDMAPPRSSVSVPPTPGNGAKNYKYWQQQRREKGDGWYFTQNVQREIWSAAKEQGDDFYN